MLVVRAVRRQDEAGLMALALDAGLGMTTLKPDRKALGGRLEIACASFAEAIAPHERDYLFVLEDTASGQMAGACAIKAAVGLHEPFYNYRVGTLVHSSNELHVFSRMSTLNLSNDLTGSAELCSLFLHPAYRKGSNGKLLAKSRFLFIAQFPHLFSGKLIAEMRGYLRPDGVSPFWDGLGQHFFKMDFHRADDLCGEGKKSFIGELMPQYPVYVDLLAPQARDAIGEVHVDTVPARRLLEQEGMRYDGYIDIFDAGPVLQANIAELRAVRESVLAKVVQVADVDATAAEQSTLISNTSIHNFRVIAANTQTLHDHLALTSDQMRLLSCATGDLVRVMRLNPNTNFHA